MAPAVITTCLLIGLAVAGVALVQGYVISEPMPADEVPGWLDRSLSPAPQV
jgi:EAL domain-containing protein (putative c-di-GMP-specific phosphodiesterase class I)